MAKTFSIENPDALANSIANLESAFAESTLRKAGAAGATVIKNEIAPRIPRDTGDLASGLSVAYDQEDSVTGKIATYLVTWIGDTVEKGPKKKKVSKRALAGWLENGRSGMAARPFVRPAFEASKGAAVAKTDEVITQALNAKR